MKKMLFALLILLCIITVALFPADLFLFAVPEWVIYSLLAAITAVTILIFVRGGAKLPVKIVSVLLTAAVILTSLGGVWCDPYFNNIYFRVTDTPLTEPYDKRLTAAEAASDLDYAVKYLVKCHPALRDGLTAEMRQRYDRVRELTDKDGGTTVNGLARYVSYIFSPLGDAHTTVSRRYPAPLYLKHYYRFKSAGYKVSAVNGKTVKEMLETSRDLYSFEAESWELECMKNDLLNLQGLDYLGFDVSGDITYTFTDDAGSELSETFSSDDFVTYREYIEFNGEESVTPDSGEFVSYSIDEAESLAVLTLKECIYNDKYQKCLRDMFTEIKAKGIHNLAVDLRDNGGGNDMTAVEFIRYLDTDGYKYASETQRLGIFYTPVSNDYAVNERYADLLFTGRLYVLTSAGSFSSAMLFPQYIKDNKLGTLIGEPPGNDPNGFGEITGFRLPVSGIFIYVSTKRFFRADKECKDKYVMPDIACDADEAVNILYDTIREG